MRAVLPALAAAGVPPASAATPTNAANMTVYAIRPLRLVDITDRDSADAAGDIFFWMKDHVVKPKHCRAQPSWGQCKSTAIIDHDMVYQTFVVEYDTTAVGPYASCNPVPTDPSGATWYCKCHGGHGHTPPPTGQCGGIGVQNISDHTYPQFQGDPSPVIAAKFSPGIWVSSAHDTECGNPRANQSRACTWRKFPGKIVNATCLNNNIVAVATAAAGAAVAACEAAQGSRCDYINAVATNLTDCCIDAWMAGVNATPREALIAPFAAAFASDDAAKGGCAAVAPPAR